MDYVAEYQFDGTQDKFKNCEVEVYDVKDEVISFTKINCIYVYIYDILFCQLSSQLSQLEKMMEKYARSMYRINRDISALEDGEDESREDNKEDISEILIETEDEKQQSFDDKDASDLGGKEYSSEEHAIEKYQ